MSREIPQQEVDISGGELEFYDVPSSELEPLEDLAASVQTKIDTNTEKIEAAESALTAQLGPLSEQEGKREIQRAVIDAKGNVVELFNVSKNETPKMTNEKGEKHAITDDKVEADRLKHHLEILLNTGFRTYVHEGDPTKGTFSAVIGENPLPDGSRVVQWESRSYEVREKEVVDEVENYLPQNEDIASLFEIPISSQPSLNEVSEVHNMQELRQAQTEDIRTLEEQPVDSGVVQSDRKMDSQIQIEDQATDEFPLLERQTSIAVPLEDPLAIDIARTTFDTLERPQVGQGAESTITSEPQIFQLDVQTSGETLAESLSEVTTENASVIQLSAEEAPTDILAAVEDQYISKEPAGQAPDSIPEVPVIQEESKAPAVEALSNAIETYEKPIEQETRAIQVDQEPPTTDQPPENVIILGPFVAEPVVASPPLTEFSAETTSSSIEVIPERAVVAEEPGAVVEVPQQVLETPRQKSTVNELPPIEVITENVVESVARIEKHEVLPTTIQPATTIAEVAHLPLVEAPTVIEVRPAAAAHVMDRSPESVPLLEFFADQPIVVEHLQTLVAPVLEPVAVVLPGEVAPDGRILDATVVSRAKEGTITYEFRAIPDPEMELSEPAEREAFAAYVWVEPAQISQTAPRRDIEITIGAPSTTTDAVNRPRFTSGIVVEQPRLRESEVADVSGALLEQEKSTQWPRIFSSDTSDDTQETKLPTRVQRARNQAKQILT